MKAETDREIARRVAQTHELASVRSKAALIELALAGGNPVEARVLFELRLLAAGVPVDRLDEY